MTHASLFSGVGGFDLAAHWAGWDNAFNCEINPFCQTALKYHFPDAKQYSDIRTTDFSVWRGMVDVLTGGFPCQPFSQAGKRKGTDDDRYLWPEMLRTIREIRPRWVVGENVLGIVNWSEGMVFQQVCADLEAEGYEVQPYVLPACGVDAPHQRYRTWFVAHRTDTGIEGVQRERENEVLSTGATAYADDQRCEKHNLTAQSNSPKQYSGVLFERNDSDADGWGLPKLDAKSGGNEPYTATQRHGSIPHWQDFPTQFPVCRGDDGLSDLLDFDAVFSGIPKPIRAKANVRWRTEAIKAYGNAIVPQVALQIFETINEYERLYGAKG